MDRIAPSPVDERSTYANRDTHSLAPGSRRSIERSGPLYSPVRRPLGDLRIPPRRRQDSHAAQFSYDRGVFRDHGSSYEHDNLRHIIAVLVEVLRAGEFGGRAAAGRETVGRVSGFIA
jgi:hypothetical protein